jgi:signal transduction histidine kinase
VIESVGATFRPLFDTKAQDWKVEVVGRITQVRADRGRLVQILSNLISNAHKYTPGGGRITARVRLDGAMLRVDVRDTGIGLTSEEQSGLFDRFYRVSNAATKGVPGTGLGLAITKALVEMHGGEVRVASVPGRGTTFSFTLPTMDGAAA